MTQTLTQDPAQIAAHLDELKTRLARFQQELQAAEGDFNLTTRRVNENLASVSELATARANRDYLAQLVTTTASEIEATIPQLEEARAKFEHAEMLENLRALAQEAQGKGGEYQDVANRVANQLLAGLGEMAAARDEWDAVRARFASIAKPYIGSLPAVPGAVGRFQSDVHHADKLMDELQKDGITNTVNVRSALPKEADWGLSPLTTSVPQRVPNDPEKDVPLAYGVHQLFAEGSFRKYLPK